MTKTATPEMIEAGFHASRMGSRESVEKVINAALAVMPGDLEAYRKGVRDAVTFLHEQADLAKSSPIKITLNGMANAIGSRFKGAPSPAALAAMPGEPVAVKPLEWDGNEAASPIGRYRVQRLDDKWEPLRGGFYMLVKHGGVVKAFDTVEEAKAYCQADYETSIRSALVDAPPPADKAEIERLRANLVALEHNWLMERDIKLEAIERATKAEAEIERLREALEPFAGAASICDAHWNDGDVINVLLPAGDLRSALAALKGGAA